MLGCYNKLCPKTCNDPYYSENQDVKGLIKFDGAPIPCPCLSRFLGWPHFAEGSIRDF